MNCGIIGHRGLWFSGVHLRHIDSSDFFGPIATVIPIISALPRGAFPFGTLLTHH